MGVEVDAAEAFGVGQTGFFALAGGAGFDALETFRRGAAGHLAGVAAEGFGFHFQVVAYWDENIGVLSSPEQGGLGTVGLQSFLGDLFREAIVAPSVGVGGVNGNLAADAVVAVGVAFAAVGVDAENHFRAVAADFPYYFAAKLQGILEGTVGVAEKDYFLDAQVFGGGALFLFPD